MHPFMENSCDVPGLRCAWPPSSGTAAVSPWVSSLALKGHAEAAAPVSIISTDTPTSRVWTLCEQWGPCPSSPSYQGEEGEKAFGLREDECLSQILIIEQSDHMWSLNRTESAAVLGTRSTSPSVHKWPQIPEQKFKACFWPQGQFKSASLTFLDWNILDQKQSLKLI